VLNQTADGRLVTAPGHIDVPPVGAYFLAVLRGAGRPGIVAIPNITSGEMLAGVPQVWHQDATGNFAPPLAVPVSMRSIYDLMTADLNGDGLDDLVLRGLMSDGTARGFEVLLQQADGSFGPPRDFASDPCSGNDAITTGDVNGDGRADILIVGESCSGSSSVSVMLQDASGGFTPAPLLASAGGLYSVEVVDVDGDGRLDIVTLHNNYGVGIYLQRADGSMAPEEIYRVLSQSGRFAVGDFTGDGLVDIAADGYLLRQKPTPAGSSGAKPGAHSAGLHNWASRLAKGSPKSAN
jgi:hypothetical protein